MKFLARFSTSAVVGIVASIVDWIVLVVAVWLGMSERWAVVPACVAGVIVQFFGNQRYTFGAHRATSDFGRQVWRFTIVELGTLALNAIVYNLLREWIGIDYRISRLVAAQVVYLGFSLPLWHWVFAKSIPANRPDDENPLANNTAAESH